MAVKFTNTTQTLPSVEAESASKKAADAFAALAKSVDPSVLAGNIEVFKNQLDKLDPPPMTVNIVKPKTTPDVFEAMGLGQVQVSDLGAAGGDQMFVGKVQLFKNQLDKLNQLMHATEVDQTQDVAQSMTQGVSYVEELVNLHLKLKELGAYEMIDRVDELEKLVQSSAHPVPDDQEMILQSPSGTVVFSAVSKKTELSDKPKAISLLGAEQWLALSSVSITDLKKYLTEAQLAECTKKGKGSRSLKSIVPKT